MTTDKESPQVGNTTERIEFLKDIIQKNFDDDNWYGYNSHRALITIAAKVELLQYGIVFKPKYNCPA